MNSIYKLILEYDKPLSGKYKQNILLVNSTYSFFLQNSQIAVLPVWEIYFSTIYENSGNHYSNTNTPSSYLLRALGESLKHIFLLYKKNIIFDWTSSIYPFQEGKRRQYNNLLKTQTFFIYLYIQENANTFQETKNAT